MKFKILPLFFGSLVSMSVFFFSSLSYANAESDASLACMRWAQAQATLTHKNNAFLCKPNVNSRNDEQWNCMYEKQIEQHWSFTEASGTCFKTAPALTFFQQKYGSQFDNIEPKVYCQQSVSIFRSNYPDFHLDSNQCVHTSYTTLEWYCMVQFAEAKNNFIYASGQCFPD